VSYHRVRIVTPEEEREGSRGCICLVFVILMGILVNYACKRWGFEDGVRVAAVAITVIGSLALCSIEQVVNALEAVVSCLVLVIAVVVIVSFIVVLS